MFHEKMKYLYVGVDSHKETHYAVVLNCFCEKLGELEFRNAPSSFSIFLGKIKKYLCPDITFVFGFEDVSEYGVSLIKYLRNEGYTIKHVNSSLVASERQSVNTLHKTDSFDAECAARVLISKFDTLPIVVPNSNYMSLSLLVTKRNFLVKNGVGIKKELQRLISKNYPSYKKYFSKIENHSALGFFERFPSPLVLKGTSEEEMLKALIVIGHIPNKQEKAKFILESIDLDGDTEVEYQAITDFIITSLIRQLRIILSELNILEVKIAEVLITFPQKLNTIQGVNTITAASLLAEIGDVSRFKSPSKLARYAGVAPVTFASGKSMLQFANEMGNRKLNSIFFMLAVTICGVAGRHKKLINPVFHRYYQKKISEGKTNKQALKCVQRRLVNIIWNMLKHNTAYINPEPEFLEKEEKAN